MTINKRKLTSISIFFVTTFGASAYYIFRPTPAKDIQNFCEMAKLSHVVSEVMTRTISKAQTEEFYDFISELSKVDSSLKYFTVVRKAEDFGLKNWECPALKKLWR